MLEISRIGNGKKVNGSLVQGCLYQNQLKPVAELDGTWAVVSRFVYGFSARVRRR